mgnify:CR=1 FL=1
MATSAIPTPEADAAFRTALIIDAMDLLWQGNVEAFALVSSDSDFTRLATRLREDPDLSVRRHAAEALLAIGDPAAREAAP